LGALDRNAEDAGEALVDRRELDKHRRAPASTSPKSFNPFRL
jgi:hypothetical protein